MVVLLGARELTAAITGSHMGSLMISELFLVKLSSRKKMDDSFSAWQKRKSPGLYFHNEYLPLCLQWPLTTIS